MEIETREQYDWALKVLSLLMNAPMNPDRIKSGFFEGLCWLIQAYEEKVTTTVPTQKKDSLMNKNRLYEMLGVVDARQEAFVDQLMQLIALEKITYMSNDQDHTANFLCYFQEFIQKWCPAFLDEKSASVCAQDKGTQE